MKKETERRLAELESGGTDWFNSLSYVDYGVDGINYADSDEWQEVHFDQTVTVYRNNETDEVRGVYQDRRTEEEIVAQGGNLAYL